MGQQLMRVILLGLCLLSGAALAAPDASVDENSLRRVEMSLATAEQTMIADPGRVVPIAQRNRAELARLAPSRRAMLALVRARWLEGEALGRINQTEAADANTRAALSQVERIDLNSQLHGRILMSRGAVELDRGNVQIAFRDYRRAYDIFRAVGDARNQALALQNIGSIYSDAGDQQSVLRYYKQSADVFPADMGLAVSAHNNLGLAYKELGQLPRAEDEYRRAFTLAARMKSPLLEARILNNIGSVQLARGRLSAADRSADRGLRLAQEAAIEWAPFLWGLKAQVALARGDAPAAVTLLGRTFAGTDLATTSFYFRDFHKTAVDAYLGVGDQAAALAHLRAFKRLDDEAREIRSSTNAALNAAQFDFSNQELKISKLQAGQLQRDLAIGRARARLNGLMLGAALLLLAVTLAGFFSVRHSRNQTRAANRRLETTNRSLDKALKAKSEFLATTSHEIRTPLNGILGMAQVLLGGRTLEAGDRERVGLINAAGNTMKAIVDDILDMAKIEAGRVEVQAVPFNLPTVLTEVGALWRAEAESKGVALTIDLADTPARIMGDERKVRQIVFNLVSNAVKFTDAGSVDLLARAVPVGTGEELRIAVRDSGIGIAPDQLGAVFEAFHQVEGGTTRKVGGTGLGLAICSNLAHALGGTVTATSVPGEGSTFELTVPLERVEAPRLVARDDSEIPRDLAEASAVMVEGNALFQSIYAASLQDKVARLEMVASLDAAAEVMAERSVDIVIVDASTVLGSPEDATTLREWHRLYSPARVMLLSGADAEQAMLLLADNVVTAQQRKTLPPVGLTAALSAMLDEPAAPDRQAAV